jgi:Putative transposase
MAAEARRRHFTEVRRRRRAHEGFSIHCGVRLHENDREGIERLCRYGARGPLTLGRLSRDGDDVYRYRMKRIVRGRDELVMTGKELVRKLAVLVPPPRVHLVRFHGVFAPNVLRTAGLARSRSDRPLPLRSTAVRSCRSEREHPLPGRSQLP